MFLEKVGLSLILRKRVMIKVLLIDDDEKLADLLKNYLSSFSSITIFSIASIDGCSSKLFKICLNNYIKKIMAKNCVFINGIQFKLMAEL